MDVREDGIAPGWDPDPTGRHQLRWWDGAWWTDRVWDFGVVDVDPLDGVDGPLADGALGNGAAHRAPSGSDHLAETVEALVLRLREISKRDKRVATDEQLRALAQEALDQARRIQSGDDAP